MKQFTYASAFAGIGGMTMGLKPLGGQGVVAWEYDPTEKRTQYAQNAHKLLHPEIPVQGDICGFNTEDLPDFDVFCFTPPCQAFSIAGKRGGFDDTRGTLTFEALRIAKAKKPKILFMENVKGLVNHDKGNTMSTIIHAINEIGYTVDFNVLNSKYFDVAQNRERVYLIAIRDDLITPEPWNDVKGTTMLPKAKHRYQEEGAKTFNFDWPKQTEVRTRLRDFLEDSVDERYYLSDDKTAALVAQLEVTNYVNDWRVEEFSEGDGVSCCIDASYAKGKSPGDVGKGRRTHIIEDSPIMLGHIDLKGHDAIKRVYSPTGQGPTLTTMGGGHREPKIAEEVRTVLTPKRLEKRQNGRRFKEDGEESFTLTAQDRHGSLIKEVLGEAIHNIVGQSRPNEKEIGITFKENGDIRPHRLDARKSGISELNINHENNPSFTITASHAPKIYGETTRYRIRKLTPRECLRLQSVSENDIDLLSQHFSDSRLYKFAGNGLTTNVIKAIGERLLKYL